MNLLSQLAKNHNTTLSEISKTLSIPNFKLYNENKKDLNQIKIKVLDDLAAALDSTPQEILVELMEIEDELK